MVNKLKKRFVLNIMMVLVFVFFLIIVGFHLYYNYEGKKENKALLYWLANAGSISDADIDDFYQSLDQGTSDANDEYASSSVVAIRYDRNKNLLTFESTNDLSKDDTDFFKQIGHEILEGRRPISKKILYRLVSEDNGYYLVMIDTTGTGLILQYSEYLLAGGIFLIVLAILFVVSLKLSRFVTKPAEDTLNKQKQFISDASHELKTPLSAILLNAEALRPSNPYNQNLENIISEASRMEKLITNLLELARADDVSNKLVVEEFNLSDAILQITLPFESEAYEANIRFDVDIEEDQHYCGNCDDIKQVVAILIDNAFKHTNENGLIKVSLSHIGKTKRISIFNTGDGISEEDLPHIFERFYSCDKSRNGKRKSYGLGLAIAKAIVENHGGTISVASEYGKYAEFFIGLPK